MQLTFGVIRVMYGERLSAADLLAELNHRINSPLAAIRNALYRASCRTADTEIHRYLELANSEITSIADTLRFSRQSGCKRPVAVRMAATRRAAA